MEETIVNLNVLAQLKKGQKLNTRGEFLDIETPYIVPECIRRWRRQDSRNDMILCLNKIINQAIQLDVQRYLDKAIVGLENLKQTYLICKQTVARLDMILDKINAHLKIEEEIVETF
jgi:hypothetical protein